jgi:hypothetical protein
VIQFTIPRWSSMPSKFNKLIFLLGAGIGLNIGFFIMAGVVSGQPAPQVHMIASPVDEKLVAAVVSSAQVQAVACGQRLDALAWDSLEPNQKVALLKVLFEMYLSCDDSLKYIVTADRLSEFRQRDHAEVMFDQVVTVKFSGKMLGVSGLTTGFIIDLNAFKRNNATRVLRRWPGNQWSALTISTPNPRFYQEFCRVLTALTEKAPQ